MHFGSRITVVKHCISRFILQIHLRPLHTRSFEHIHPILHDFTNDIGKTQPCFGLQSKNIQIFSQPNEFYRSILRMIRSARRRIFLSSLYIGSSEFELINALNESLNTNPNLHLYLHLDYNRSTRLERTSTAVLISPLLRSYQDRVHVYLYKSPKLKGTMARIVPRRFDEGWGTWHAKVYGVDDEVIISGKGRANLNKSYFTDRQDRYLHFNSPSMAEYCFTFLRTMADYCFKLCASETEGESNTLPYRLIWSHKSSHPQRIEQLAGNSLHNFQKDSKSLSDALGGDPDQDVIIFPLIQCGQFGVREEENCLIRLFKHISFLNLMDHHTPHINLTSGYFGLYKKYQRLVINSTVDCQILAASPQANGFYGAKDISGRIPEAYTHLEQKFWRSVCNSGRQWQDDHGIQLEEWFREGWTYHAKGIWLSPNKIEPPIFTIFGSTNLNSRSANLDLELIFVMIPSNSAESMPFRQRLGEEMSNLKKFAVPWQGLKRKVRPSTQFLASLVGGML